MDTPLVRRKVDDSDLNFIGQRIIEILQHKIILGKYTDKRYVESLEVYRDVIIIESTDDIDKLFQIKKVIEKYADNRWIGITRDPQNPNSQNCLLWTQLKDVPVGKHWFSLSGISIEANEIVIEVEHVEPYRIPDRNFNVGDSDFPTFDLKEIFTYQNMCEAIKFSMILFMTLFTFLVEVFKYLADYSIKLSYVFINFVHVSTPICMGIFEFLTKCVAGFYWLIYAMFRGNANTPTVPAILINNQRSIGYTPDIKNNYQNFKPNSWQDQNRYPRRF